LSDVRVQAPPNPEFSERARELGGSYEEEKKEWSFPPEKREEVDALCKEVYGNKQKINIHGGKPIQAWWLRRDWEIIESTLREMERVHGWREVEGRNALQAGHEMPPRSGESDGSYRKRQRSGEPKKRPPRPVEETKSRVFSRLSAGNIPEDMPQTARQLMAVWRAAEWGDAECQYKMGRVYSLGSGVEHNMEIASGWMQLASLQGHEKAIKFFASWRDLGYESRLPPTPMGAEEKEYVGIGGFRRGKRPKEWIGEWIGERIQGVDVG